MDLSIIIPVYNGAATIGRCLDSIYSQGLDEKKFEVICVDDCSPDPSSVAAIENYKFQGVHPSNLILTKNSVNKKVGGARNTGIRTAKGEWIQFVDCDDFLIKDSLIKILSIALSHQKLEMLSFDFVVGTNNHVLIQNTRKKNRSQIMRGSEYHICQSSPDMAVESLYRRSCISLYNTWFVENVFFEDTDFVIKYLILAKEVLFVPIDVYYYVQHEGQATDMGANKDKIRDAFLLSNRLAYMAIDIQDKYKKNANAILVHANAIRLTYFKRNLWQLSFFNRLEILREIRLPFKTRNKYADFISVHPFITSVLLSFLNMPLVNTIVRIKKIFRNMN